MQASHEVSAHLIAATAAQTSGADSGDDWFVGGSQELWSHFLQADSAETYCRAWLTLLCRELPGTVSGMVLLGEPDVGPFTPVAVWPRPDVALEHLSGCAEHALRERRGVVIEGTPDTRGVSQLAYPIEVVGALRGVVVLESEATPGQDLQAMLRRVHWGICWLEVLFQREAGQQVGAREQQAFLVLELLAGALSEPRYQAAVMALVTELATRLNCERVSLGMLRNGKVRVEAVSHSATFGREMNLTQLMAAAMEEAVDQGEPLFYPPSADSDQQRPILHAHQMLAQQQGAASICTVPLHGKDDFLAVLTLERPAGHGFARHEVELCELLGEMSWPQLDLKRNDERFLITKAAIAIRTQFEKLFGAGYLVRKALMLVLLAIILFFAFARGDYRISGDTRLEGAVLRAVSVPFDGFVASADARAGDTVAEGQTLATLDDREFKVDRVRLGTERAQYEHERREAAAAHDRARVRILSAQIDQVQAQLELADERLQRTRLVAPFDGLVVSGDLSQSLGAPVQRGDVVFEVAPLDAYRMVIQVDERDIAEIETGQSGRLVLSAIPDEGLPFTLTRINPVTSSREGRNYFEVEAKLVEPPKGIRPGMEGVAKVDIGERRLIWIWTRTFMHWARLFYWSMVP